MHPILKYGATFLAGLGLGGFVVHSIYEKKIEHLELAVISASEALEDRLDMEYQEMMAKAEANMPDEAYQTLVTPYSGEVDPDFDTHFAERQHPVEDEYVEDPHAGERRDRPYIISDEEYNNSEYDTETLYYYTLNGVLTLEDEDGEEVVSDPENFLGVDVWKELKELSKKSAETDGPNINVRDDNFYTDYEIYILDEAYKEEDD